MAGRKKVVADKDEAMKNFTEILRDDESKAADRIRAGEHLIKYGEEQAQKADENESDSFGVMIVDDIPKDTGD